MEVGGLQGPWVSATRKGGSLRSALRGVLGLYKGIRHEMGVSQPVVLQPHAYQCAPLHPPAWLCSGVCYVLLGMLAFNFLRGIMMPEFQKVRYGTQRCCAGSCLPRHSWATTCRPPGPPPHPHPMKNTHAHACAPSRQLAPVAVQCCSCALPRCCIPFTPLDTPPQATSHTLPRAHPRTPTHNTARRHLCRPPGARSAARGPTLRGRVPSSAPSPLASAPRRPWSTATSTGSTRCTRSRWCARPGRGRGPGWGAGVPVV